MTERFIWTRGGRRISLTDPRPEDMDPEMVAHSLARICRWTGHVNDEPYSVAQHCIIASLMAEPEHALAALAHDAPEAIVGDVSSPMKGKARDEWSYTHDTTEAAVAWAMGDRFGVQIAELPEHVRTVDHVLARFEADNLVRVPAAELDAHFGPLPDGWEDMLRRLPSDMWRLLQPLRAKCAADVWMSRYRELGGTT